MNTIPALSTTRLRLRAHTLADLDAHADLCADEEVMQYVGTGGIVGRDAAWRQLAMFLGQWPLRGYGVWALELRSERRLIGHVGFLHPEGWPSCELCWTLVRSVWGQGLAFGAASAARAFGRDALGIEQPISLIRGANARSIRLPERLGAVNTGSVPFLGGSALLFQHP